MKRIKYPIQTATFGVDEYEIKPRVTYRPPIPAEYMSCLRLMKHETGKPITKLVVEALDCYFKYCNLKKGGEKI